MMKIWLLIILCGLCFISCETSSPRDIAKAEIEEKLEQLRSAYNQGDLTGIMENYHPYFLHNGNDLQAETTIWEIRLNQYSTLDFQNVKIDLNGDFATVEFILYLGVQEFIEPSIENGDLSYFYNTYESWLICGNEFIDDF